MPLCAPMLGEKQPQESHIAELNQAGVKDGLARKQSALGQGVLRLRLRLSSCMRHQGATTTTTLRCRTSKWGPLGPCSLFEKLARRIRLLQWTGLVYVVPMAQLQDGAVSSRTFLKRTPYIGKSRCNHIAVFASPLKPAVSSGLH